MEYTVTTVARKGISLACVEDKKVSPKDEQHPQCQRDWSMTRSHNTTRYNYFPPNRPDSRRQSHRDSRGYTSDRSTARDHYRSQFRDHYRSPIRSNRCSSNSYCNMHYHQNNPNTMHINSLESAHIPKNSTPQNVYSTRWSDSVPYYPSFQNKLILKYCPGHDRNGHRSMYNTF